MVTGSFGRSLYLIFSMRLSLTLSSDGIGAIGNSLVGILIERENMSELGVVSWNDNLERYFAETGEKANCLAWVHKRSEEIYSHRRTFVDIPVIVISSLTGFLSASSTSLFEGQEKLSSILLGVASLLVSVINTIGTYFSWAKRAEAHRLSAIQYARLYRFLAIELNLPREERMSPTDLLKYCKDSYDRLQEVSPLIPPELVSEFKKKFSKVDIAKAEELNGLDKITIYRETFSIKNPLHQTKSETSLEIKSPPLVE